MSGFHEPLSCRVDGREVYATIPETGLTHRIRALFENAIRSEHGSQCPLLWRMYLNFLVRKYLEFLFLTQKVQVSRGLARESSRCFLVPSPLDGDSVRVPGSCM